MGVGRGDQDLLDGYSGLFGSELFRLHDELGRYPEVVNHDHGQGRLPVIKDESAGVERIVRALREIGAESTGHIQRKLLRCDVRRESPGAEDGGFLGRERMGTPEARQKEEEAIEYHSGMFDMKS